MAAVRFQVNSKRTAIAGNAPVFGTVRYFVTAKCTGKKPGHYFCV